MNIKDVYWTPQINILIVECDCGLTFKWQTNISLIECKCGKKEWWHGDAEIWNDIYNVNYVVANCLIK